MTIDAIVRAIDAEIANLHKVKVLLTGTDGAMKRRPGRPTGTSAQNKTVTGKSTEATTKPEKRRTMSTEGRAKIAAAQKARWAKSKRAAKKAAHKAAPALAKKTVATKTIARKAVLAKKSGSRNETLPAKPQTLLAPI